MARIEGRVRMRKVLKAIDVKSRQKVRAAILAGAEDMAGTMRTLAPYDHLKDAIEVTPGDEALALYNKQKSKRVEKDPYLAAVIHVDAMDAAWTEFGTPPHINLGQYPGTQHPGTRARPYFWPGYRSRRKQILARVNKAARQGIKEGLR